MVKSKRKLEREEILGAAARRSCSSMLGHAFQGGLVFLTTVRK